MTGEWSQYVGLHAENAVAKAAAIERSHSCRSGIWESEAHQATAWRNGVAPYDGPTSLEVCQNVALVHSWVALQGRAGTLR